MNLRNSIGLHGAPNAATVLTNNSREGWPDIFIVGIWAPDRRRYMIGLPDIFKWEYGAPDAATVLVNNSREG